MLLPSDTNVRMSTAFAPVDSVGSVPPVELVGRRAGVQRSAAGAVLLDDQDIGRPGHLVGRCIEVRLPASVTVAT